MKTNIESFIESLHNWKGSEVLGHYICHCGTTGVWNKDLQKIEVLEPVPYETFTRRHSKQIGKK